MICRENMHTEMHFLSYLDTEMAQVVAIVLHGSQVSFIIHIHYHGYLWPGDDWAKAKSTLNILA